MSPGPSRDPHGPAVVRAKAVAKITANATQRAVNLRTIIEGLRVQGAPSVVPSRQTERQRDIAM
jgi:hypothetical protein